MNWDKTEKSDEKTSESKKPHLTVPYASFVKHITEKYGLGDEEDFKKRVDAINNTKKIIEAIRYDLL